MVAIRRELSLVPLLALLVLTAFSTPSARAASASGLRGLVTRSPITPVCVVGVPCSAPAPHTTLVFSRLGRTVETRTDADGRYRVVLRPGTWSVRTTGAPRIGTGVRPATVRVVAGRFRVVNLDIDTGIR